MKFKLLQGLHIQHEIRDGQKVAVEYSARDANRSIVVSDINLEQRFGSGKFQRLDGLGIPEDSALLQQLRAQQAEIDRLKQQLAGLSPTQPEAEPQVDDEDVNGADALDLEGLSVKELKALAARESIEIDPSVTKKSELINLIRSALDAQ